MLWVPRNQQGTKLVQKTCQHGAYTPMTANKVDKQNVWCRMAVGAGGHRVCVCVCVCVRVCVHARAIWIGVFRERG